jgi:hypothetical protein
MRRISVLPLCVLLTASAALAGQARLSGKPTAAKANGKVKTSFTVSASTDVEVAILDANGKVVRHLAAGVLGGRKAPPPPLKAGLSQSLEWDMKDDLGKPAAGGPFKVRVRAGMGVKFGRMIGGSPYTGTINGLTVDKDSNLYILMQSNIGSHGNTGLWPWHVRKFDKAGKYVKSILPYPPSTPAAKASGYTMLKTSDGAFTPANQNSLYPVFAVFGNTLFPKPVAGSLAFIHSRARKLNLLKLDGSNALKPVAMWSKAAKLKCPKWLTIQVALSPDGKYAYYSNVAGSAYDGKKPSDINPKWPQGRVYRQDLSTPGKDPVKFFDLVLPDFKAKKYWMPSAWDRKTAAAGIDVDAKGHLFVCDLVNHEVVEVSPAGKKLSAVKIPWPDKVHVNPKTGDLYVFSRKVSRGSKPPPTIYKVVGRGKNARVTAKLPLTNRSLGFVSALDTNGAVPVLWVGGYGQLVKIEDRGGKLVQSGDNFLNRDKSAIRFVQYMDVDTEKELVYVLQGRGAVWRHSGETGKGGLLKIKAADLAVGPGGYVYTWGTSGSYAGPIARYSREMKPAPLPGAGKHTYAKLHGRMGRGNVVCGIDVDIRGRVYVTQGGNSCHVEAYDESGKLMKFDGRTKALTGVAGWGGSLRVDNAGNIYVVQPGRPKGFKPPAGFEKDTAYRVAVGSIYKFGPKGGGFTRARGKPTSQTGVLNVYPGCSPNSQWRCAGSCVCTKPRFDVDGFGRLYIPDAITFKVQVVDNSGNQIVRFGGYGNFDCQGPKSKEPKPEIPMGWPVTAGASDKYIYVGDCLNHRVVRADKTWATQETVDVK